MENKLPLGRWKSIIYYGVDFFRDLLTLNFVPNFCSNVSFSSNFIFTYRPFLAALNNFRIRKPLYVTINGNIETEDVQEKINAYKPLLIFLTAAETSLNVKTYRIAHELTKKEGLEIRDMKHITKKNPSKRKVLKILIVNRKRQV